MITNKLVMYECVVQAVMEKLFMIWTCYMLVEFLNTSLSHWVTATNGFFVCRTDSLQLTILIYVAQKMPKCFKNKNKIQKMHTNSPQKNSTKNAQNSKSTKKCNMFGPFGHLFWNIYNFSLTQWLHATNKKLVFRSDSVWQTKQIFIAVTQCDRQYSKNIPNSLCLVQKNRGTKAKNKHPFKFELHHRFQIAFGYIILYLSSCTLVYVLTCVLLNLFLCLLVY